MYTAADYRRSIEVLDSEIAILDDQRQQLIEDIEYPHIAQKVLQITQARINALLAELFPLMSQRAAIEAKLDVDSAQATLDAIYVKIDAKRVQREEYVQSLALYKCELPTTASPAEEFRRLASTMPEEMLRQVLSGLLVRSGKAAPTSPDAPAV